MLPGPESKERTLFSLSLQFTDFLPFLPCFFHSAYPSSPFPHCSIADLLSKEVLSTYYVLMIDWGKKAQQT